MTAHPKRSVRAVFPAGVWTADVERRYPVGSAARAAADQARRIFEPDGVPEAELRGCLADGPDGTELADALKVYLPLGPLDPMQRPFGMVFIDVGRDEPALVLIAFGVRHPPVGSHLASVYRRAHQRLHPERQ